MNVPRVCVLWALGWLGCAAQAPQSPHAAPTLPAAAASTWPEQVRMSSDAQLGRLAPLCDQHEWQARALLRDWWQAVRLGEVHEVGATLASAQWASSRRGHAPGDLWRARCGNGECAQAAQLSARKLAEQADVRCEQARCTLAFRCPHGLCAEDAPCDVVWWLVQRPGRGWVVERYDER